MDVVDDHRALFSDHIKYNSFSLMFHVSLANPLDPTSLARAGTRAEFALGEAVKAKDTKYGGTYRPT